jgi:hypothetical protein
MEFQLLIGWYLDCYDEDCGGLDEEKGIIRGS